MTWKHDELAADLLDREHRGNRIAVERIALRGGILDVVSMRLSWTYPRITGFEVKISRSDFLGDVRSGKYKNYLESVKYLFFAVPKGMIDARECPDGCGLIVRGPRAWRVVRPAPPLNLSSERHAGFVQAVLFRHYPAMWQPGSYWHRKAVMEQAGFQAGYTTQPNEPLPLSGERVALGRASPD